MQILTNINLSLETLVPAIFCSFFLFIENQYNKRENLYKNIKTFGQGDLSSHLYAILTGKAVINASDFFFFFSQL